MRALYLLGVIYIALSISSCTATVYKPTPSVPATNTNVSKVNTTKDPLTVSLLTNEKPVRPYKVVAQATISKYNRVGIKRQEATIHDILRQLAASVNGDAVIDMKNNGKEISATVIAYKQILA